MVQAAAIDTRWTSLVASDQTELRFWRLEADSIGMKPSDNEKKLSDAQRSEAFKFSGWVRPHLPVFYCPH